MASILSHPSVPIGIYLASATRLISEKFLLLGVTLSMAPDLDIIMHKLGFIGERGPRVLANELVVLWIPLVALGLIIRRLRFQT